MQAPPKRDPLGTASKNQLNRRASPAISGRKRKRAEDDDQAHDAPTLAVSAIDPNVTPQSADFVAIAPMSRADLPLAWIEQGSMSTALPVAYTFTCPHTSMRQLKSKHVMSARLHPHGRIYALESVKQGVFVAVLLSQWVTEEMVRGAAGESRLQQTLPPLITNDLTASRPHSRAGSTSSATSFRLPTPSSPRKPTNKKGAMARAAILKPREQTRASPAVEPAEPSIPIPSQLTELGLTESPLLELVQPSVESLPGPPFPVDDVSESPLPHSDKPSQIKPGTVESLRMQYLETLYLSRTSLAFYAKSSLARARAQLKDPESVVTVEQLKELYDSAILPTKKMEKKYKESIPTLLRVHSSEIKKRRKKISSELKLGKNCLYTGEEELLQKWWLQEISERTEISEPETKKLISELRIRETEMQVLLVLETLVLQTIAAEVLPDPTLPTDALIKSEPQEESLLDKTPEQKNKRKRARNYLDELETLLERMCIWHAVTPDEFSESSRTEAGGTDRLKSFCTDIAIPFYASKVPSYVKTVCKKLGGPSISPQRPKIARTSSSNRSSAAARSSQPKKSTKMSLQRVLSEDQDLRHASPPILSRSTSDKGRSSLKREPSEIMSRPQSRAGLQKAVSFSNREVDLVADARTQETKRRKLEKVAADKKQLQEAIQALKKPNRTGVAKEIMDEAERRAAVNNAIQITATPRKVQRRTVLDGPDIGHSAPPPDPVIPSSTMKPTTLGFPRASAQKRAVLSAIHDTPSRGHMKTSDPLNLGRGTSNGPLVAATPATNRLRADLPVETPLQTKMSRSGKSVLFTPMKRSDVTIEDAFRDAPEIPEKAGKAMDRVMGGKGFGDQLFSDSGIGSSGGRSRGKEDDIYAQLGWDDDS